MTDTTTHPMGEYAQTVYDACGDTMTERQVLTILTDHSLSFDDFDGDNVWDELTDTWGTELVLGWLGY